MAQKFKEVAHLRTDMDKYGEGYDRIFKKQQAANGFANHPSDEPPSAKNKDEEDKAIKELARRTYIDLGSGQDTEGFPESGSFIYGFYKGFKKAIEENGK